MAEGELGALYPTDGVIFREGDQGDVMYVIQEGEVRISKTTDTGEVTIATLGAGEFLGEMALFDKKVRSATATVSTTARILTVDKKKLFATISRDPTLAFKIIETMCQRIRQLDDKLSALAKPQGLFATCFNLESTCTSILAEAKKFIQAENGSIMLLDGDGALEITAAFGKEAKKKAELRTGLGIAGDVVKNCRAEMINNVVLDSRYIGDAASIRSLLCIPLKSGDRVLGVLNLSNHSDQLFTVDDLRTLNSLAGYASVAVEGALRYVELRAATEEVVRHATLLNA
jgi:transcriptional regulator with GAF, ATPase, and Fis domain